jgi:hypothetical protein
MRSVVQMVRPKPTEAQLKERRKRNAEAQRDRYRRDPEYKARHLAICAKYRTRLIEAGRTVEDKANLGTPQVSPTKRDKC